MKNLFLLLTLSLISFVGCNKREVFWDQDKLIAVTKYAEEIGTFALVIQTNENIVVSYGDIDSVSRVHSIRKVILMALISQHLDKINLQSTLSEINIDDYPIPLTELQKTTKIIHLLKNEHI